MENVTVAVLKESGDIAVHLNVDITVIQIVAQEKHKSNHPPENPHPCTTSTIEHSFSSLRSMKTWLRSIICENRLNALDMLSIQ